MIRTNFCLLIFMIIVISSKAQETISLWENVVPGAMGTEDKDNPTLSLYFADKTSSKAAVLICPGGGYANLAMDHEGKQIAEWFNENGVHAFVLKYRLGKWDGTGYKHPIMLDDVKRAFRLIRAKADQWNIDSDKIGVMGFSARGPFGLHVGHPF